ncbi:hypothetical protein ACFPXP_09495, partial [Marinicrinis lubricantis]
GVHLISIGWFSRLTYSRFGEVLLFLCLKKSVISRHEIYEIDSNGKKINNTSAVSYKDEYVFENGKWLIANRTSTFVWQDRKEINP